MKQFLKGICKIYFGLKNSGEILNKLKSKGFLAPSVTLYDFSTLYTTLPHNLIKEKITELIEQTFNREGSLHLASFVDPFCYLCFVSAMLSRLFIAALWSLILTLPQDI